MKQLQIIAAAIALLWLLYSGATYADYSMIASTDVRPSAPKNVGVSHTISQVQSFEDGSASFYVGGVKHTLCLTSGCVDAAY